MKGRRENVTSAGLMPSNPKMAGFVVSKPGFWRTMPGAVLVGASLSGLLYAFALLVVLVSIGTPAEDLLASVAGFVWLASLGALVGILPAFLALKVFCASGLKGRGGDARFKPSPTQSCGVLFCDRGGPERSGMESAGAISRSESPTEDKS